MKIKLLIALAITLATLSLSVVPVFAQAPTVTTGTAVNITTTTAVLQGTFTTGNLTYADVSVFFQYNLTGNYSLPHINTVMQPISSYSGFAFTQQITGLTPNKTYHFRAALLYGGSTYVYGSDATFSNKIESASTLPDDILVPHIYVNRNIFTDSATTYDELYLVHYDLQYEDIPTDYTVDQAFYFELIDTDNTTILGFQLAYPGNPPIVPYPNRGYGEGVVAFYIPSSNALVWGTPYIIRIEGNPTVFTGTVPLEDFTIVPSQSYTTKVSQADNEVELQNRLITITQSLEKKWSVVLLDEEDQSTVFSTMGEKYFRNAIPYIQNMAPSLFFVETVNSNTDMRSWGTSLGDFYKARLNGADGIPGTADDNWIRKSIQNTADTANVPYDLLLVILTFVACGYCIYQSQKSFQTPMPGYVGSVIIILCAGIVALGFTIIGLVALALAMAGGYFLWLRRA